MLELDFKRGKMILMIGKQASGKSYLTKSIIYQCSKSKIFKFGIVFTGSKINGDYDFLDDDIVREDYSEENLEKYINKLRKWCQDHPGEKLPRSFLILDDLLGRIRINSPVFANLMSTYRHYNLTIIITSQYMVKNCSTLLRELVDYAFIFRTRFKNSLKHLYESFGQMTESYDDFFNMLEMATKEEHFCLMYDATKDKKETAYKSYRAPGNVPNFKLKFG